MTNQLPRFPLLIRPPLKLILAFGVVVIFAWLIDGPTSAGPNTWNAIFVEYLRSNRECYRESIGRRDGHALWTGHACSANRH
jgi:hypothetical protein